MFETAVAINAVSLLKDIASYLKDKKNQDPELLNKIVEFQSVAYEMMSQNAELTEKVYDLEARLKMEEGLEFSEKYGIHYKKNDEHTLYFCMRCKAEHSQLIPLKNEEHGFTCGSCGQYYAKPEYELSESSFGQLL